MKLRYMIIGAGGTGAPLGAYLTKSGAETTLIARGAHLKAMQENGLTFEPSGAESWTVPVTALDMDGCLARQAQGMPKPDVIFVCVKGYSLDDTIPFIRRAAHGKTVVIPILNIYGTGRRMQAELPELLVTDGCIYISSNLAKPGVIQRHGSIFRVIYGLPDHRTDNPALEQVTADLTKAGIDALYSPFVEKDTLLKFSHVSPMAACGQYYHVKAGAMQQPGEVRDSFIRLVGEIVQLAEQMGIPLDDKPDAPLIESHLKILDELAPTASTSMQRDIEAGKNSEVDGLIYQVVRLADQYHLELPEYRKIAKAVAEELRAAH